MNQQVLHFHFHNPNTAEATADHILKILLEANRGKLEQLLREAGTTDKEEPKTPREI